MAYGVWLLGTLYEDVVNQTTRSCPQAVARGGKRGWQSEP